MFERGLDEDPNSGALACCLRVITEVHRRFFEQIDDDRKHSDGIRSHDKQESEEREIASEKAVLSPGADVRTHLKDLRSEILSGCCILFSKIFPKDTEPESHPLWQLARQVRLCTFVSPVLSAIE